MLFSRKILAVIEIKKRNKTSPIGDIKHKKVALITVVELSSISPAFYVT